MYYQVRDLSLSCYKTQHYFYMLYTKAFILGIVHVSYHTDLSTFQASFPMLGHRNLITWPNSSTWHSLWRTKFTFCLLRLSFSLQIGFERSFEVSDLTKSFCPVLYWEKVLVSSSTLFDYDGVVLHVVHASPPIYYHTSIRYNTYFYTTLYILKWAWMSLIHKMVLFSCGAQTGTCVSVLDLTAGGGCCCTFSSFRIVSRNWLIL